MANIKVVLEHPLFDGMAITFNAPCDCSAVNGVTVCYLNEARSFTFRDAHGNDLTGLGNLFSKGAYVKAILDVTSGYAYIQNADTNGYLEKTFAGRTTPEGGEIFNFYTDPVYTGDVPPKEYPGNTAAKGAHAQNFGTHADGEYSSASGWNSTASGGIANATGRETLASGYAATTEGHLTTASGRCAHAGGKESEATGENSFAHGLKAKAKNGQAFAIGNGTEASGSNSFAGGKESEATGTNAFAHGYKAKATNNTSFAIGEDTEASGYYAIASGYRTKASGTCTTAGGRDTEASEYAATAMGRGTIANSRYQFVRGQYNEPDVPNPNNHNIGEYAEIVGGGSANARKNIYTLDWSGNAEFAGKIRSGGVAVVLDGLVYTTLNIASGTDEDLMAAIDGVYTNMTNNSVQFVSVSFGKAHPTLGGTAHLFQIYRRSADYGVLEAVTYGSIKRIRSRSANAWGEWDTFAKQSEIPVGAGAAYIVAESTVSNLTMKQQQASDPTNNLANFYFDYTCRKWSDGIIEIFGRSKGSTSGTLSQVETTATHAWGSLYETGAFILPNYPEQLKSCLYANVSFASTSGNVVWAEGGHWGNLYGLGNVYFCRATAGDGLDDVKGNVCTYTVGTWK